MSVTDRQFKVALTGDFFEEDGAGKFRDMGLSVLEAYPRIDHFALSENIIPYTILDSISTDITSIHHACELQAKIKLRVELRENSKTKK